MFLPPGFESASHSSDGDGALLYPPTIDSTLDFSFSDSFPFDCDFPPIFSDIDQSDLCVSSVDPPEPFESSPNSVGDNVIPNIALPSEWVDVPVEPQTPMREVDFPALPREAVSPVVMREAVSPSLTRETPPPFLTHEVDSPALTCKQRWVLFVQLTYRRLARMQILKQKRSLGLIHIANSYAVRYNQKRLTALQKSRYNGKFISEYSSV